MPVDARCQKLDTEVRLRLHCAGELGIEGLIAIQLESVEIEASSYSLVVCVSLIGRELKVWA